MIDTSKGVHHLRSASVLLLFLAAQSGPAQAQSRSGTTLAAYKTIDICAVNTTTWRYSGTIALWNEGAVATQGLNIYDRIQNKTGTVWIDGPTALSGTMPDIPAGTTQQTATLFNYSVDAAALPGTIRNVATITILQHRAATAAHLINEQLSHALNSRVILEQAKGMIAERQGINMEDAFNKLRSHARNHNALLVDVAREVIDGTIGAEALNAPHT